MVAPARVKAFAVSYSELVPGKAGMRTLGFWALGFERRIWKVEEKVSASLVEGSDASGKTSSRGAVQVSRSSSSGRVTSPKSN